MKTSLNEAVQTDDLLVFAYSQRALGEYYSKINKPSKSIAYLNESIKHFEKASDSIGVLDAQKLISQLQGQ